ncbi:MAG: alpha/beta hydrolase [Elusimicrobia bacterium]|nr:alpha/beta hydrolase [Elusimicrobiota bacterium]MDE2509980.1 alpha/beta hydrolase [Elusimicrobiota bacterium]
MTATPAVRSWKAGPVHLRDWGGSGAPVLLLHGMAAHSHWWDGVAPRWNGSLRAAAVEFRGHGDSDWSETGVYSADLWLEDIETARRALGWERFILCGHSMGARMALNYAERHPGRLRGVAAVDFLPELRADRPSRFSRAGGRPQPVYPTQDDAVARFRLEPGGTTMAPEEMRRLGQESVRPSGAGWSWKFDWRCLSIPITPVWPQLSAIRVPAMVARGSLSELIGPEDFRRVAAEVNAVSAVTIEGAHHHVPLDKPVELAQAVADFAADLPE